MQRRPCKLEVPLSPLVAEAAAAAAAAAASAILMAFLVLALLAAAEAATVVPEAVFMTADAPPAVAGADSPSLESLESPPGRLARLLVDLHLLRQARLLLLRLKFPHHLAMISIKRTSQYAEDQKVVCEVSRILFSLLCANHGYQYHLRAGVALPFGRSCWSGWRGSASASTVSSRAEWKSCTSPSIFPSLNGSLLSRPLGFGPFF